MLHNKGTFKKEEKDKLNPWVTKGINDKEIYVSETKSTNKSTDKKIS